MGRHGQWSADALVEARLHCKRAKQESEVIPVTALIEQSMNIPKAHSLHPIQSIGDSWKREASTSHLVQRLMNRQAQCA